MYLAVTPDIYELPLVVADAAQELSNMVDIKKSYIFSSISMNNNGKRRGMKFIKVEDEDMLTKLYQVTDVLRNKIVLDNTYSQEIVNYFDKKFTNVSRYARNGKLYQGRYLFEEIGSTDQLNRSSKERGNYLSRDDMLSLNTHTVTSIYEKCNKFEIGVNVNIIEYVIQEHKKVVLNKIPAKVIERYSHHLVVQHTSGVQESFIYKDIVLLGVLEITQGRPKKSN